MPFNEYFDVSVKIKDRNGDNKIGSYKVASVEATMPAHKHGMNVVPLVTEISRGLFKVEGMLFHMPGQWEIHVDLKDKDENLDHAIFEVQVQ